MNKIAEIPHKEFEMLQFTRFFSGKFQNLRICAGVKNLQNFKGTCGTVLGERESFLCTFIVVCYVRIQFLIRPVRRKYS